MSMVFILKKQHVAFKLIFLSTAPQGSHDSRKYSLVTEGHLSCNGSYAAVHPLPRQFNPESLHLLSRLQASIFQYGFLSSSRSQRIGLRLSLSMGYFQRYVEASADTLPRLYNCQ